MSASLYHHNKKRNHLTEIYCFSSGEKESLFDIKQEIEGAVPMLPDDLDIDKDGNIYWSDASSVSHLTDSVIEVLSDPSGRLVEKKSLEIEFLLKVTLETVFSVV